MLRSSISHTGRQSGKLPNIYWRAIDIEALRAHDQFVGLPPVEQLSLEGTADFRFVRQDSALWREAHTGVLTTGILKEALGFYEPNAAKIIDMPHQQTGHGPLLRAWHHLQHPVSVVALARPTGAPKPHNSEQVTAYNSTLQLKNLLGIGVPATSAAASSNGVPSTVPSTPKTAESHSSKSKKNKNKKKHNKTKSASSLVLDAIVGSEERRKLGKAAALGSGGIGSVRCAWGTAQESSALFALLSLCSPDTLLHEVGLCLVDPHMVNQVLGCPEGSLPPLGASPDACIHYQGNPIPTTTIPFNQSTVSPLAPSPEMLHMSPPGPTSHIPPTANAQDPGFPNAHAAENSTSSTATEQVGGVVSALRQLLQDLSLFGTSSATSSSSTSSSSTRSTSTSAPPTLAARSSTVPPAMTAADRMSISAQKRSGQSWSWPSLWQQENAVPVGGHLSGQSMASRGWGGHVSPGGYMEVVELKNTCPFQLRSRVKGGKMKAEYVVSDPGPREQVRSSWVPQLQLEMLSAGTSSALLVSRSATKGFNVFRVMRDDAYLTDMLSVIQHLYCTYVIPGVPPPANAYQNLPFYTSFLHKTVSIAREAQLVAAVADGHKFAPMTDMRLLLDSA